MEGIHATMAYCQPKAGERRRAREAPVKANIVARERGVGLEIGGDSVLPSLW